MTLGYVLDEKTGVPRPCEDWLRWGNWMATADRQVADDTVGEARVSTVFLGTDHSFGGGGPPVLFETMIFGGPHDQWQDRYTSREDALKGHAAVVAALARGEPRLRAGR